MSLASTARAIIRTVAAGEHVPSTYGPDRPIMRDALISALKGIEPTEADRIQAALGYGNPRRIAAYDKGVEYMRTAYNTAI